MRQREESGSHNRRGAAWVLLTALLGSVSALAQPSVPATAFLENEDAVGAATAVALWRNEVDPDASRILVAEGEGGLVHYALDGSDPQNLLPLQTVRGLTIAHHGGGLEEGEVLVASLAPASSSLIFYVLAFNEEGSPTLESYEAVSRNDGSAQGFESAQSLAFSVDTTGRLFLFVAFPNEVEQLEVEFGADGLVWNSVAIRAILGAELLASGANGNFVFAASPPSGILSATTNPEDPTGFVTVFSSEIVVPTVNGLAMDTRAAPAGFPEYLLTSQGFDDVIRVFEPFANPPRFVDGFRVLSGNGQLASPTWGLALTTEPVGQFFPEGLLIVTTGVNGTRRGALVSWGDVARSFEPPLHFVEEDTGGGGDGGTGNDGGTDGGTDGGPNNPVPGGPDIALPQLPREEVGCGCTGAGSLSTVSLLLGSGLLLLRRRRR